MSGVQVEIVAGALEAATREMVASLIRTAFSPNIKERADCSTALCDIEGRALSLMTNAPAHLGSTLRLVPELLKRFPLASLREGDAFLANDPYIVGVTHLNDCTVVVPVFAQAEPVGFAVAVAHHSDVGGRVPGSEAGDNTSIFQDGLRVPPVRIRAAGQLCGDMIELFLLNSRTPHFGEGDLMAQLASCERGVQRLGELFRRHGIAQTREYLDRIIDATEARLRARIREVLTEGVYEAEDWLDDNGVDGQPVRFVVRLTVRDGTIEFDCSDCPDQVESGKNVPLSHTLATAYFCLSAAVDPYAATNEGLYRTVRLIARPGSILNPLPPAAVGSRNTTSMVLADAMFNALGQAGPARAIAACGPGQGIILSGHDAQRSRYFVDYENFAGGQGARGHSDGLDVVQVNMSNTSNLPVESLEMEFPLRIERYEMIADSGGAGRFRGGLGAVRDVRVLCDKATVALRSARQRFAAGGLAGGRPGALGAFILNPDSTAERRLPSTGSSIPLARGDVLRVVTPGGGGFGDPRERDRERVRRDREQGKVSVESAAQVYRLDE